MVLYDTKEDFHKQILSFKRLLFSKCIAYSIVYKFSNLTKTLLMKNYSKPNLIKFRLQTVEVLMARILSQD